MQFVFHRGRVYCCCDPAQTLLLSTRLRDWHLFPPIAGSLHFASSCVLCCLSLLISYCQQTLCEQVHSLSLTKAVCYSFLSFSSGLTLNEVWRVLSLAPQCNIYKEVFLRPCDAQWRGTVKKRWIIITWKRSQVHQAHVRKWGLVCRFTLPLFPSLTCSCWHVLMV